MAARGQMKSVVFKQAALAVTTANVTEASATLVPAGNSTAVMKVESVSGPVTDPNTRLSSRSASPVAAVAAAKSAPHPPRFTAEETILLRGIASGASSKEMAAQMRLPRESLYRLMGDLRRKTGASTDTALAVWVLRNADSSGAERRGGGR
jgi:DNA-binding CsgD family transcriptional regulator